MVYIKEVINHKFHKLQVTHRQLVAICLNCAMYIHCIYKEYSFWKPTLLLVHMDTIEPFTWSRLIPCHDIY